jgi:hypothetical protein
VAKALGCDNRRSQGVLTQIATARRPLQVHEEEWSYIPVGGPLPAEGQAIAAFGAAANLVHPATGFSVSRSLREAPGVADAVAATLRTPGAGAREAAAAVWATLWPAERRRQAAFHLFGMELLTQLDLGATNDFFRTFFALPPYYWRGFLGSNLSSVQLVVFAMLTFVLAPAGIKAKLVSHLLTGEAAAAAGCPTSNWVFTGSNSGDTAHVHTGACAGTHAQTDTYAQACVWLRKNLTQLALCAPHTLHLCGAPDLSTLLSTLLDPSGAYLARKYLGSSSSSGGDDAASGGSSAQATAVAGLLIILAQQANQGGLDS